VIQNGGKVYRSNGMEMRVNGRMQSVLGPLRISPGRLAVSRAFGDIDAKQSLRGGNPHVLIAEPEITVTPITDDMDFIILASDGIFDKLLNREVVACAWNVLERRSTNSEMLLDSGLAVDNVMNTSLSR
jgi:protein phosphatase 2C family protein 2/3